MDRDERVWAIIVGFSLAVALVTLGFLGPKVSDLEARLEAVERHQSK